MELIPPSSRRVSLLKTVSVIVVYYRALVHVVVGFVLAVQLAGEGDGLIDELVDDEMLDDGEPETLEDGEDEADDDTEELMLELGETEELTELEIDEEGLTEDDGDELILVDGLTELDGDDETLELIEDDILEETDELGELTPGPNEAAMTPAFAAPDQLLPTALSPAGVTAPLLSPKTNEPDAPVLLRVTPLFGLTVLLTSFLIIPVTQQLSFIVVIVFEIVSTELELTVPVTSSELTPPPV